MATNAGTGPSDLDRAAAKLLEASTHLEWLTTILVQHASQGSGLGGTVGGLTGVAGTWSPKAGNPGWSGLFETILPRQASDFKAGGRVLDAGKQVWGSLFGGGKSGRATSLPEVAKPEKSEAGGEFTLRGPLPLPVVIVGGAQQASVQSAASAIVPAEREGIPFATPIPKGIPLPAAEGAGAAGGAATAAEGAGAAGGAATAAEGAGAAASAALGPVAAVVALGKALWDFKSQVEQSTRAQLELNRSQSEYAAAMAQVFAEADARDVFRTSEVGNRAAGSARFLSNMDQTRKDNTKELDLLVQNIGNTLEGILNAAVTVVAWLPNNLARLVNKYLFDEDGDQINGFAEAFEKQAREEEKHAEERRRRLEERRGDR